MFTVREKDVDKTSMKLHRQFGHASSEKLLSLLKKSGCVDAKLLSAIKQVSQNCETCIKFNKPVSRPVVSLPMANHFNDVVSMDLKFYKSKYFLVMVDLATRYCAACVISDKKPDTIVRALFTKWISVFGAMKQVFHDNAGELKICVRNLILM